MKTDFGSHILWYDGTIEASPEKICDLILAGVDVSKLAVNEITEDIVKFNRLSEDKLHIKTENNIPPKKLLLSPAFEKLDINRYAEDCLLPLIKQDEFYMKRLERFIVELDLFEKNNMTYILNVLLYVIDTFKRQNVVWGVGRGSSCASYILYLIGLHSIDPIKYDIPITEFFKN